MAMVTRLRTKKREEVRFLIETLFITNTAVKELF